MVLLEMEIQTTTTLMFLVYLVMLELFRQLQIQDSVSLVLQVTFVWEEQLLQLLKLLRLIMDTHVQKDTIVLKDLVKNCLVQLELTLMCLLLRTTQI